MVEGYSRNIMNQYLDKYLEIFNQIDNHAKIVLSTSYQDKISSRMMSFIIIDGLFYFQTDKTMRKYQDLKKNKNVSLCLSNIQIEEICIELGHPTDNHEFCHSFQKYFLSSYNAYTHLSNKRLFVIKPTFIQRWNYIENQPIIERLFIQEQKYVEEKYM